MSEKSAFAKVNTSAYRDFKRIGSGIVLKFPALKGSEGSRASIHYATCGPLSLIAKCFNRHTFKTTAKIDNFFKIIGGDHARVILTPNHVYYLSECANAGTLQDCIDRQTVFTKGQLISFITQMAHQLSALQSAGYYHGELTPSHILVNLDQNGKPEYQLCGFGHLLHKPKEFYESPAIRLYLDPRAIEDPCAVLDSAADIWSLGVIVDQLATGKVPALADWQDSGEGLVPPPDHDLSSALSHFVSHCVVPNPRARVQPNAIPFHPFFIPTRASIDPYVLGKELGSGRFCHVNLCTVKGDPSTYAVKVLNPLDKLDQKSQMLTLGEINILRRIESCPYAIRLHDHFELDGQVHLVLELCPGGDLEDYIVKQKLVDKATRELCMVDEIKVIAFNLASALYALHSKYIVHRDIKPKNALVFLDPKTKRLAEVKLSDFGTCKELIGSDNMTETIVGTPRYIAPEIYEGGYSHKVDVWSYGIILYYLAYGMMPSDYAEGMMKRKDVRYPPKPIYDLPDKFVDLIKRCLLFDPERRYNMQQVLSHSYFKSEPFVTLPAVPKFYEVDSAYPIVDTGLYAIYHAVDSGSRATLLMKVVRGNAVNVNRAQLSPFINELIILRGCPQLFKLHQNFIVGNDYHFILDLTDGQTLQDYVKAEFHSQLPIQYIRAFGRNVGSALNYMHSRGYIHSRVSPLNVLVCAEPEEEIPTVKLTGICPFVQEVIQDAETNALYYKPGADDDVYKFGELLYFLVAGNTEGYAATPLKFPAKTHLEEKDYLMVTELIKKCAEKTYLMFSQILSDPFFTRE